MDLSALIFVALAVAWAAYLIPKALQHHEDASRSATVERFSDTMRVLARREPVDKSTARLVVGPGRPASTAVPATESVEAAPVADDLRTRRSAAAAAAKRRLRVVCVILGAHVVVAALAAFGVVSWSVMFVPLGILVAWLVACRMMVKRERYVDELASYASAPRHVDEIDEIDEIEQDAGPDTEEIGAVGSGPSTTPPSPPDGSWDPQPMTLPTYVSKEQATRRSVRTIDLESTGVWTSGRTAVDSQIAREAEAAERSAKQSDQQSSGAAERRATGS